MLFAIKELQAARELLATICTAVGVEKPEEIAQAIETLKTSATTTENPLQALVDGIVALLKVEKPEQLTEGVTTLQTDLQTAETLLSGLMTALAVEKPEQLGAALTTLQTNLTTAQDAAKPEAILLKVNKVLAKVGMEPIDRDPDATSQEAESKTSPAGGLKGMAKAVAALKANKK